MSRIKRVESLLKEEIAKIIQQDFKYNLGLISIIDIKISKDLANGTVHYSHFGSTSEKRKSIEKLNKAAYFIQEKLNKSIRLKRIPSLNFKLDDALEKGSNIINELKQLEK